MNWVSHRWGWITQSKHAPSERREIQRYWFSNPNLCQSDTLLSPTTTTTTIITSIFTHFGSYSYVFYHSSPYNPNPKNKITFHAHFHGCSRIDRLFNSVSCVTCFVLNPLNRNQPIELPFSDFNCVPSV